MQDLGPGSDSSPIFLCLGFRGLESVDLFAEFGASTDRHS